MKIILTERQYKKLANEQLFDKVKNFFTGGDDNNETTSKTGCSVDTLKPKDWKDLYSKLVKNKMINQGDAIIIVWGPSQKLYYTRDGKSVITSFPVSTGANGFGNSEDDKKTPTGLMKTRNTVSAPNMYQVLVGKKPYVENNKPVIVRPGQDSNRTDSKGVTHKAEVITGLVELEGKESCNSNVFQRNIYFHGTNRENYLGSRASNGCIRVSNPSIKWLIGNISKGTWVYIQP